jgi:hypothetical protein
MSIGIVSARCSSRDSRAAAVPAADRGGNGVGDALEKLQMYMALRESQLVDRVQDEVVRVAGNFVPFGSINNDLNQLIKKLKHKRNRSNSCADNKTQKRPYFRREKHIQSACEEVSESVSMRPE